MNWFGPTGLVVCCMCCALAPFSKKTTGLFFWNFPGCEGRGVWSVVVGDHKIIVPKLELGSDNGEDDVGMMWWVWILPFKQPPCAVKWENHLQCRP